ncbi:MAG: GTP cyclohydrolase I FolE [bacterium]
MKKRKFDRGKVEKAIRLLLEGIGEDPDRPGLRETPSRVCGYYEEILSGMWQEPQRYLVPLEDEDGRDFVVIKDIPFVSICEHHLLPFIGKVSVAYQPGGSRIVGISKIVRTVDAFSHRLQIQERLTDQITESIRNGIRPRGLLVLVEAEHLCMTIRGVKKPGSLILTSRAIGSFSNPAKQALVLSAIGKKSTS